ncbi:hypothetical protein CONCODRAFT_4428, partial [Conidiobolus coronatus NRRL 28638]
TNTYTYGFFLLICEVISFWYWKLVSFFIEPSIEDSLVQNLNKVKTYSEYSKLAKRLDNLKGNELWKSNPISKLYDHRLIYDRFLLLQTIAENLDEGEMMQTLRTDLLRNIGGLNDPKLYSYCYFGTKYLIEDYINELATQFEYVSQAPTEKIPFQQKLDYFRDTSKTFGQTALILQGGASFGIYHIGVAKTLFQEGLLPQVISGSEMGAFMAGLVCIHTDEELPNLFMKGGIDLSAFSHSTPEGIVQRRLLRLIQTGNLMDLTVLQGFVFENIGDITFQEAYAKTGRILNITVSSTRKYEVPQILNYITAPNVLIWSAACASSASVGLQDQGELLIKDKNGNIEPWGGVAIRWLKTSNNMETNNPHTRLSELFNVNHFIVSQASPYIIPFMTKGIQLNDDSLLSRMRSVFYSELKHRVSQLIYLKLLPSSLRFFVDEKFQGDITIFPSVNFKDFKSLFSDPTQGTVEYWMEKGSRSTFPLLELIRNRCKVEFVLNKIYHDMKTSDPTQNSFVSSYWSQKFFKRTKSIH